MKITIYGCGYVGLVTGACMADAGNQVLCVDVDGERVAQLNSGRVPIFEPGLEALVHDNHAAGRLKFSLNTAAGVAHGELQFIAVGTPQAEDGAADLRYVQEVAGDIGRLLDRRAVIVNKSTVPVGTGDKVRGWIAQAMAERDVEIPFAVVSNPEFLKEGAAVADFMKPDRIILGAQDDWAIAQMRIVYAPFNRNHDKLLVMDLRSAELTKYAANAMLATKISFMNEMANIAENVGADIEHVRLGIGSDPRIGYAFIYPGAGYGGSCFPKDVSALTATAAQAGYQAQVLQAVDQVNRAQKMALFGKLQQHFDAGLDGLRIALWGLSFKPETDDMREAPSRTLMEALWSAGASVQAYDPQAMDECRRLYPQQAGLQLCESAQAALEGADALVLVTEWKCFWSPDFELVRKRLRHPVIVDGRNIYAPEYLARLGFSYYGIGRH